MTCWDGICETRYSYGSRNFWKKNPATKQTNKPRLLGQHWSDLVSIVWESDKKAALSAKSLSEAAFFSTEEKVQLLSGNCPRNLTKERLTRLPESPGNLGFHWLGWKMTGASVTTVWSGCLSCKKNLGTGVGEASSYACHASGTHAIDLKLKPRVPESAGKLGFHWLG